MYVYIHTYMCLFAMHTYKFIRSLNAYIAVFWLNKHMHTIYIYTYTHIRVHASYVPWSNLFMPVIVMVP